MKHKIKRWLYNTFFSEYRNSVIDECDYMMIRKYRYYHFHRQLLTLKTND